jgi:hypothetical protein
MLLYQFDGAKREVDINHVDEIDEIFDDISYKELLSFGCCKTILGLKSFRILWLYTTTKNCVFKCRD